MASLTMVKTVVASYCLSNYDLDVAEHVGQHFRSKFPKKTCRNIQIPAFLLGTGSSPAKILTSMASLGRPAAKTYICDRRTSN